LEYGIDISSLSWLNWHRYVISKRFRCHILWIWRNLTEFYEIVTFVNSVRYKLDGHWLRHFQINQSVIVLNSRLVLRNIVWGK
jgi:hypothetical protein